MRENLTIGFIGNPNCGKTTLFNAYTGANLKVANWPGVTVEKVEGAIKDHDLNIRLVDLPLCRRSGCKCQEDRPVEYSDEFKQQLVELYRSGKRRCDICREYDIATSLFDKWVKQASNSGSFHEKDNRTPEQEELIRLRKENQQLRMENDILKQAALILGRK